MALQQPDLSMDDLVAAATQLAQADEHMRYLLVRARKDAELSQRDVARALGIKQSSVAAFERHDNDPRLSTIRRYALAVGAKVEHRVTCASWPGGEWRPVRSELSYAVRSESGRQQFAVAAPLGGTRSDFAQAA
jgi:transcriptional regulator with XRE-family HTH domain